LRNPTRHNSQTFRGLGIKLREKASPHLGRHSFTRRKLLQKVIKAVFSHYLSLNRKTLLQK
jgi:hypothetical protein